MESLTTWLSQRAQARARQLAHEMSRRDDLYKDFIVAASKAYGDAVLSNEPQIQELLALHAMISRMRLMSSPRTVACAEKVMETTIATYFAPNKTIRELHDLAKSGVGIDPHVASKWPSARSRSRYSDRRRLLFK